MAENYQPISPVIAVITELVSTGVMGVVAAMWWTAYKEERKRSKELADNMAEISLKQVASEMQMINAITQNNAVLKETSTAVATNTAVMQSLSDRIGVMLMSRTYPQDAEKK